MPKRAAVSECCSMTATNVGAVVFNFVVLLAVASSLFAQNAPAPATYTLKATPKTAAWGYYDAKAAPVLRVKSGDTVSIETLITNSPKRLGGGGLPRGKGEKTLGAITHQ